MSFAGQHEPAANQADRRGAAVHLGVQMELDAGASAEAAAGPPVAGGGGRRKRPCPWSATRQDAAGATATDVRMQEEDAEAMAVSGGRRRRVEGTSSTEASACGSPREQDLWEITGPTTMLLAPEPTSMSLVLAAPDAAAVAAAARVMCSEIVAIASPSAAAAAHTAWSSSTWERALEHWALAARPQMREQQVVEDGNCLFRAVGACLLLGQEAHLLLRHFAVATFLANFREHAGFLSHRDLSLWEREMQRAGAYGDHFAMHGLADGTRSPVIVFREGRPQQSPTIVLPLRWTPAENTAPIALLLDESRRGSEHYTALLPPL